MNAVLFVANICGWVGGVQGGGWGCSGGGLGVLSGVFFGRRSHIPNTVCMQEI